MNHPETQDQGRSLVWELLISESERAQHLALWTGGHCQGSVIFEQSSSWPLDTWTPDNLLV